MWVKYIQVLQKSPPPWMTELTQLPAAIQSACRADRATLLSWDLLSCPARDSQSKGARERVAYAGSDFKFPFLTAWCSCVLQACLTDIGPRGGSALKSLPRDIFAPFTSFSAFLLTPGVGNFPQPKTRQKGGKKGGERYAAVSGQTDRRWARHT